METEDTQVTPPEKAKETEVDPAPQDRPHPTHQQNGLSNSLHRRVLAVATLIQR
ncbi:hypothetical protein DSO57_1003522 [Entomophthora muscae]|uniref:Uncharacterized protein n=1 Tax=Entomophthora muscae TaxID=34485 RepID=A0ACC2SAJ6_9FUNG|nr:hypothetical protein DSO57_1003522 [Entomophthora muscae]